MIPLIGLCGPAGAGKSTAASALAKYQRAPLASPIKRIAREMGWNGEKDPKGRLLLQLLGTECGRQCLGEDCWINKWTEENAYRFNNKLPLLIDDVRFDNEASFIARNGGVIIRITREATRNGWFWESVHPSEKGISDYLIDHTIENNGTVQELWSKLNDFLARYEESSK